MKNEDNKKLTFKEKLKDKRERAKLELMLYGIFFICIIIFARLMSSGTSNVDNNNNNNNQDNVGFITSINDNYEYDIKITMNDKIYEYYGMVLGNNSTVNVMVEDVVKKYYIMNNKYYALEDNNYILVDEEEVYPYVNHRYLNINNIKEYVSIGVKENDMYRIKISDIVLNSESADYFTITVDEGDKSLVIDYTELFKLTKENIDKVVVNITYDNIGTIISLGE